MVDSMVWHHHGLHCVSILIGLSVMDVQDKDEPGNSSGLSSPGELGLNGADLFELVDSKVLKTLFEAVSIRVMGLK